MLAMVRAVLSLAVATAAASTAPAAATSLPPPATIVVDLVPAAATPAWLASAYEQTLIRELSGFERLAVRGKTADPCAAQTEAITCRLRFYKQAGVDLVLFGRVTDDAITYELAQTWTPAQIATGAIAVGREQTAIGFTHAAREALRPVLTHGGLLDQRPYAFDRTATARTGAGWQAIDGAVFGGVLVALVLPFALLGVLRRVPLGALLRLRSARRALGLVAVLGGLALIAPPNVLAGIVETVPWLVAGLGGLAWGVVLVIVGRAVFPPLDGLERIPAMDVQRIVLTWCLLCGERLLLLGALHAPLGVLVAVLASAREIPALWAIALVAPALALIARLSYAAIVECIAVALDRKLVDGPADETNPWSREIGVYLMGYVRRTGWDLDPQLLAEVRFLPGKPSGGIDEPSGGAARFGKAGPIAVYGGGLTHARVVIDRTLLELAIGPLEEVDPDEQPAVFPDWSAACITAGSPPRLATADALRGRKLRASPPGAVRKPLGRPATLLGHVMPAPGQVAPLISDNLKDLAVVRELLSEHYPWYAPDPDDEWDPTDPTDKDFLFGVLVRELGVVRRGEAPFDTLKWLGGPRVARITSRYRSRIADGYAALNFARHHLIQHLYAHPELMTARARPNRLNATSVAIFAAVLAGPKLPPRTRARLAWLSQFFAEPIEDRRGLRLRRFAVGALIAAMLGGAGIAIKRSLDYHDTYLLRMQQQERGSHGQEAAQTR
jgi:hypothetical protein